MAVQRFPMVIGDELRAGDSHFGSVNPFTAETWAELPQATNRDLDDAVAAARAAGRSAIWGRLSGPDRSAILHLLGSVVEQNAEELAHIETSDNGKVIRETLAQMRSIGGWYRYFAGLADKLDSKAPALGRDDFVGLVRYVPRGVVGSIIPWNSPMLLLAFKLAPALAAGCTMVVKPSDIAPVSPLVFARKALAAGLPPGVLNVVTGEGPDLGVALVEHPGVDMVAFTGSTAVGKNVGARAGGRLIPSTLELGGKSAHLVFADADPRRVALGIASGVFAASGQTCVAGSRALVHEHIYAAIREELVKVANAVRLGDPTDMATDMGPIAFPAHREQIRRSVEAAVQAGARVVAGGEVVNERFFQPTVLEGVSDASDVWQKEIFGPVVVLATFTDEHEAIDRANDSMYGLAAGIWTDDFPRAVRVAQALEAGTVWINDYRTLGPQMPFEGWKQSGLGFENGAEAILQFCRRQALWFSTREEGRDPFRVG